MVMLVLNVNKFYMKLVFGFWVTFLLTIFILEIYIKS